MIQDKKPPVVSCDSSELKVPVNAKEKDLLKGVTAKDNRSGDVSNTLVVENMSEFTDNGKRTVTYAAGETVDVSSKITADSVLDGEGNTEKTDRGYV